MTIPQSSSAAIAADTGYPLGKPLLLLLLALFAGIWFGTLDYRSLINPDEGRYAEIPREMVATGDWLTPRLNTIKYFEKPALQYWATAAAFTLFGEHEWTARLWSALCGFGATLFAGWATRRLWGGTAAIYATSILAGSLLWQTIGHVNTLDMSVSAFLSSAIFCLVLAQRDTAGARETRNFMWLGWLMLALAVLSKGLIGLVLPATTLCAYTLWQRDLVIWRRLHLLSGLALLLAVTAPWFIAVSLANPEFARFFFIHEHFERFLTKTHGRYQPVWYFLPILLIGMLPWLTALVAALPRAAQRDSTARFQPQRFLLLWCLIVFGFFSMSGSKLASYILPLFPALAALIGLTLAETAQATPMRLRWHALPPFAVALIGLYLAPQATQMSSAQVPAALYANYIPWLQAGCGILAIGCMAAFACAWITRPHAAVLSLAFGGMLFAQIVLLGHQSLAPANSAEQIAARIHDQVRPDVPFFSVNLYDQSLPFYLKRSVTMVFYKDELGFGIEQEPHKFIEDKDGFEKAWHAAPDAWALMDPDTHRNFLAEGLPMRTVTQDSRRIVVRKP